MNKLQLNLLFACLIFISGNALYGNDQLEHKDYDWEKSPELTDYTTNDTNVALVYLKNYESREFIDSEEGFTEIVLVHKHIKVFTDRGIEQFNKLYLPVFDDKAFLIEKARVINSKGEIIELREEDVKEGVDEDSEQKYRYFALEGIDKGAEIEFIYMYNRSPQLNGVLKDIQRGVKQYNFDLEVIAPARLKIAFKIYNDDKEFLEDTTQAFADKNKSRWFIHYDSISELSNQRSSAYDAELIYFGYKLSANYATNKTDLYSYGEFAKLLYKAYHENIGKKDKKFAKKLSRKIDVEEDASDREKIRTIEEFVKSNARIIDVSLPDDMELEKLWDTKIFSEKKALILFVELFKRFDIKYQIGLTSNRFDFKFDPDFELWRFADEYIVYFPTIDDYMTPDTYERLGFFNYEFMHNHGLFVKGIELAGEKYGVGSTRFIPQNDYKDSGDTLVVEVDFKEQGFSDTEYDIYHSISGYKAEYMQPYFREIDDEEDKKELKESLLTFIDNDGEVSDLEVKNLDISKYGIAPVQATGVLESNKFFEKARDNYLFKVGELIGLQVEMYTASERTLPVEEYFNRHYDRTIKFTIPDGYTVENLDKLNIHEFYRNEDGETTMEFKSSYTKNGDEVTVRIIEYYTEVVYPLEIFEEYQRVINAAADFNKVIVIFDKTE